MDWKKVLHWHLAGYFGWCKPLRYSLEEYLALWLFLILIKEKIASEAT